MKQAIEIRGLPRPGGGWLAHLRIRLFGSGDQKKATELRHCSRHLLRDIGLLDDRRASRLLCDDAFYRR
jgi:hypothetical protein